MSLFISFVPPQVTVEDLERVFDETFGATVMVYFGKLKTNTFGKQFKTASVEVLGNTPEMTHFISQVKRFDSNVFTAEKVTYTVRMDNRPQRTERTERTDLTERPTSTSRFTPYIA
jgi:hypothetical protein